MKLDEKINKIGFPLEQWFDISKRISKTEIDLCEAQMMLYALKDNIDPEGSDAQRQINEMKRAVKLHNSKFDY